jgi:zinc protease
VTKQPPAWLPGPPTPGRDPAGPDSASPHANGPTHATRTSRLRNRRTPLIIGAFVLGLLLLASTFMVRLQQPPNIELPLTTLTLANGMRVAVHEDHKVPTVKVMLRVGVGSADEPPGRSGFAHLFEHVMFMGTEAIPKFDRVMEELGGSNNAWTDYDETVYYSVGPSHTVNTLLWMEADRFANIPAAMTDAKLDLQRKVVLNELSQNVFDTPGATAGEVLGDALFPDGHPYERPIIGSVADIKAATTAEVNDFFARFYRPSNITLTVTGDVDTTKVLQLIEAQFSRIPDRTIGYTTKDIAQRKCEPCRSEQSFTDALNEPRVSVTWAWPTDRQEGRRAGSIVDPDLELVSIMLNDEFSSTLQQDLVRKNKQATSVSAFYSGYEHAQFFTITADAASGVSTKELRAALLKSIDTSAKKGFTRPDVVNAQTTAESLAIEFETANGKADVLSEILRRYDSFNAFTKYRDRFFPVDEQTTTESLRQVLATADRVIQTIEPGDRTDTPDLLTESSGTPNQALLPGPKGVQFKRPADGTRTSIGVPRVETVQLANGMKLRWFERDDAPRIRLRMLLPGGYGSDPANRDSESAVLATVMTRGAGPRTATEFEDELEAMGSELFVQSYLNDYSVGLSATEEAFTDTLELLQDVLLRPTIDAKEVALVREQMISSIEQSRLDANLMASLVVYQEFFPPDHALHGTTAVSDIKRITQNTLRLTHQNAFQPSTAAELIGAGPLSAADAAKHINRNLGGWLAKPKIEPRAPEVDTNLPPAPMRTVLVNVPDTTQTVLYLVATAPGPLAVEDAANRAAVHVLGGAFSSRLMQKLREEKGYTYGASASLEAHPEYRLLWASTSVEQDVTGDALRDLFAEVRRFRTGDITDSERLIGDASRYTASIGLVQTGEQLIGTYEWARSLGIPWETVRKLYANGSSLTKDEIAKAARSVIDGNRMMLVVAGDLEQIQPQLSSLPANETGPVSEFSTGQIDVALR